MTVLPCDVDDSGMMTNERYGRHGAFALRKFWIRNGVEKLLSSRGGGLSLEVVSRQTTVLRRATSAATGRCRKPRARAVRRRNHQDLRGVHRRCA